MRRNLTLLIAFLLGASATAARGDGFSLDRFEPAPAGDAFFAIPSPTVLGHLRVSAVATGDFARAPLVLRSRSGTEFGRVVESRMNLRLALSMTVRSRVLFELQAPLTVLNHGDSPRAPDGSQWVSPSGFAMGDLRAGVRVRLVGDERAPVAVALAGTVWLPSGRPAELSGDGSVRGGAAVLAGGRVNEAVLWSASAGLVGRSSASFANNVVGSELHFGAAAGYLAAGGRLLIGPEFYAASAFAGGADLFASRTSNAEIVAGIQYRGDALVVGLGAGPGLTVGMGTPDLRMLARVGYVPRRVATAHDRDGDGIADVEDACPTVPGVAHGDPKRHGCPPDRDDDAIADVEDACPLIPGVRDPDRKKNGCPPDRDGDGIVDAEDACPTVPGVRDADPKKSGCPADRDDDGIVDQEDACPDVRGVRDDDPKKNGCPPDRDGDGIVDQEDGCPRERGPRDPDPSKNGCPTLVRVTAKQIVMLQKIHFGFNTERIMPDSSELLTQVAQVLKEHPEITRISIEGHTDAKGGARFNQRLSHRRAEAVKAWLADHGIEPGRLETKGFGKGRPVDTNRTEQGRERNRRVEFHIVPPEPPGAPPVTPRRAERGGKP